MEKWERDLMRVGTGWLYAMAKAAELVSPVWELLDWGALWWMKWLAIGFLVGMLVWCGAVIVLGIWVPDLIRM